MTEQILTLLTAVLGGANLLQFLYIRSTKRLKNSEATMAELNVKKMKRTGEDELLVVIDDLKARIVKLTNEAIQCYDELADVKASMHFYKNWACFKHGCKNRIDREKHEKGEGLFEDIDRCK